MHSDGYYLSDIKKITDKESDFDYDLFSNLKDRVKEMLKLVNFDLNQSFWETLDKTSLKSFLVNFLFLICVFYLLFFILSVFN